MKAYLAFMKIGFQIQMMYRANVLITIFTNITYIVLVYFLWKEIFNGREEINGMSFNDVLVYLVLASTLSIIMQTYLDWIVSMNVTNGQIAMDLIKPIDFQLRLFSESFGWVVFNFVSMSLPALVVLFAVFKITPPTGIQGGLFIFSALIALFLNMSFQFGVGLISFYTESLWGIVIAKDAIVSVFSGLLIPLPFFPNGMRQVVEVLPFQAIYHTPLTLLTNDTLSSAEIGKMLAIQFVWATLFFVASRLFYQKMRHRLVINGG